ncbi:uncharacterized protein LOC135464385 [Liolophura sinensis]|uniref:uncharacterized protein LOC135464385 n=1 Tax=Liolophura sinensis TaxID=3198878 RepID=UPI0031597F43
MSGDWQHGVCGCFDNCGLCIITYFCPCYTFGKNAEAVGDSCCLCCLCYLIPIADIIAVISVRGKIRNARGISGSCIGDLCIHFFCHLCALVQEAQEIQGTLHRGMAIERE